MTAVRVTSSAERTSEIKVGVWVLGSKVWWDVLRDTSVRYSVYGVVIGPKSDMIRLVIERLSSSRALTNRCLRLPGFLRGCDEVGMGCVRKGSNCRSSSVVVTCGY